MKTTPFLAAALFACLSLSAQKKERAREFGIPFDGKTGIHNAITDVPGVLVGYKTLISGSGKKAVRTGVTVILPKGKTDEAYPAGWFCLNGDGEMTGTTVIDEYGLGYGPIGITNTNSVGVVRDAMGAWSIKKFSKGDVIDFSFGLPVAAETFDGLLNDINGLHVKKEDVFEALDNAASGPIAEGNVGGGTGMSLFLFKGGSGTASRVFKIDGKEYTIGAFVQGNFGGRKDLMISGVPVGKEITEAMPKITTKEKDGSIIVILATDAPLLPSQLKQLAKRASIGVARTGGFAYNSSGDIFMAFSTAAPKSNEKETLQTWTALPKELMDSPYRAAAQATEEAIINALMAAETMEGFNGNTIYEIPKDKLREIMTKYGRMEKK
ncbi:P1 family peptidase [Flavobacterium sp. MAH-1]|uniref:P1 family peptidase n=1 Tax=Flavobacterium agri TaxID=2743471 RepID=A0A7Y8XYZ7_9FLAO|nr:P1 family peptidase [Flavobacterium agri]NUY79511.1 P1 family peptidase [Flavobacterium agri]NYA69536.1 P1 family peptidase [Flavobacterium agri]